MVPHYLLCEAPPLENLSLDLPCVCDCEMGFTDSSKSSWATVRAVTAKHPMYFCELLLSCQGPQIVRFRGIGETEGSRKVLSFQLMSSTGVHLHPL
jgi:hypothetical protein